MKERPILFSAPMVRAILEGRKTQTRRVVKPQSSVCVLSNGAVTIEGWIPELRCPYGQHGDRIWVRETFKPIFEDDTGFCGLSYRAGGMPIDEPLAGQLLDGSDRWRPSIHMPRWASRITLEIAGVRVERLQAIGQNDAVCEGVRRAADGRWFNYASDGPTHNNARSSFISLWESINGPGSWDANQWVWVIEFKRIQP